MISKLNLSVMMTSVPKYTKFFLLCLVQSSEIILSTSSARLYHPLVSWLNLQFLIVKPQNFGFYSQSVSLPEKNPHPSDSFLLQIELFFICFHQASESLKRELGSEESNLWVPVSGWLEPKTDENQMKTRLIWSEKESSGWGVSGRLND